LQKRYSNKNGSKIRLKDIRPDDVHGLDKVEGAKGQAETLLREGVARMTELQDKLYAQDRWSLLLIFQAMDAAGKDGAIKHVMSGVNPQGVQVFSFKGPSAEELDHDYMWRTLRRLPERGRIGIFNRSYYEEVLVVRAHPELLASQRIPSALITNDIWKERYEDINNIERYLSRNGVIIRKFFLHVSREQQRQRLLTRVREPEKNWKCSPADARERHYWDDYMSAYEGAIQATASKHAPWFVVPADHKWFARLVVSLAVVEALEELNLAYPVVSAKKRRELRGVEESLVRERPNKQKGAK
jgi:PPK2 family polyphosphate:nucleotide phosphotransferase